MGWLKVILDIHGRRGLIQELIGIQNSQGSMEAFESHRVKEYLILYG